jgi:hypothetical protein
LPPNAPSRGPFPLGFSFQDHDYWQDTEKVRWFKYHFLGLVHGHFDVRSPLEDMANEDDASSPGSINTGLGVVIPAQMVLETLYQDDLNDERRRLLEEKAASGATPDNEG